MIFDICTIGSGTRDVFLRSKHFEEHSSKKAPAGFDVCFPMGAKIGVDEIFLETGGGATNVAVSCSNLGLKTTCICAVGDNENGDTILDALEDANVNTRAIQVDKDHPTSYSVILLAGTGQRSILAYRGASNYLDLDKKDWKKLKYKYLYLSSMGGNLKKVKQAFLQANLRKAKIAWNPGGGELLAGMKKLKPFLEQTDFLFLNKEEVMLLTQANQHNFKNKILELASLIKNTLVVTDGPRGAKYYNSYLDDCVEAKALKGKRINTTGAGDAFASAFMATYLKTNDLDDSLRVAMLNSLGTIQKMGAKVGILKKYPSQKEIKKVKLNHC